MKPKQNEFRIQRENVARYFFWIHILIILLATIWMLGAGAIVAIVYAYTTGTWFPQKQADGLRYWLDGSKLRVDQGVYFLKRKTIPLDRVTDITLSQGPLLRHFGLWSMTIQTAGRGSHGHPEATLIGLENPEEIREALLNARDAVGITG